MRNRPIVALIYDFDGTLSPGNMQEFGFIQAIGKKPQEFWQESDDIAMGQDASNILSYMKLMFDEARKAGIKLRREKFKEFGKSVELFEGVKEWFGLINEYGKSKGVKKPLRVCPTERHNRHPYGDDRHDVRGADDDTRNATICANISAVLSAEPCATSCPARPNIESSRPA